MAGGLDYRVILAAVADVDGKGQVAARKAVELAHLTNAEVVLYHASYESSLNGLRFFDNAGLGRARREHVANSRKALQELAQRLCSSAVSVRALVEWKKSVAEGVVRAALREHADLVVAEPRYQGTRRHRLGLTHTDWELVRVCPMPLLFSKTAAPYSAPSITAAVDPGSHQERESALDVNIVGSAAALAKLTNGSVELVHVIHMPPRPLGVAPKTLRKEMRRVETLLKRLSRGAGLKPSSVRVVEGQPVDTLLELVSAESRDLIVMGTFVTGPVRHALFGSTAERILNLAPCDVLILKPDGFISPVPPPTRRGRGGT